IILESKLAALSLAALGGREFTDLDSKRYDVDIMDSKRTKLGGATVFAQRVDHIEAAIEGPAVSVANAAGQTGKRRADDLRERPLHVDFREVCHIGRDQRGCWMTLSVGERRPRQVVRVLTFNQVGKESLERPADGAAAQHQPVVGAARNMRGGDRNRGRPLL